MSIKNEYTGVDEKSIAFMIRKVNKVLTANLEGILKQQRIHVSSSQIRILVCLLKHDYRIPLTYISKSLGIERATLTRNLLPLRSKNLIQKTNQRGYYVITPKGKEVIKKSMPICKKYQEELLKKIDGFDHMNLETFSSLMTHLIS